MMGAEYLSATDTDVIQKWAEDRGGAPGRVKPVDTEAPETLEIYFPDFSGTESIEALTWDEFFERMEEQDLVFVYQEETAKGEISRVGKLVTPDVAREMAGPQTEESDDKLAT